MIIHCDKELSIIDVCRKVARERNARKVSRFAPKTSHQSNGFVEAVHGYRDSHDASRHKLRRTLMYNFHQFHLPFHLQFVALDLFSQDSQCDPTAELHSNICLELHKYHFQLVACMVNYGVEIRISSVNRDNTHSWVRFSHGSNKFVMNLNNNEQETSEVQFEEFALRLNASDFASRLKAKAKPQRRDFAGSSTKTILILERIGTYVEPGENSLSDFEVSKKLIHLRKTTSRKSWSN